MVPKIRGGTSFKGAGLYYLHDKREEGEAVRLTTERVAWTHTLNCASDDPEMALREMQATALNQQALKLEAGKGPGGERSDEVVKTISLSWDTDQNPDQATMIAASESYLKHMGWQDHQALIVAHNDTAHPHVHIVLNKIHPETGLLLNEWQEQKRTQPWALQYEKDEGKVRCEIREAKYDRGEAITSTSVPYEVARAWKQNAGDLYDLQEMQQRLDAIEWDHLKQAQRDERDAYQKETKALIREARSNAYREVREEFRPQWKEHFAQEKAGVFSNQEQADQARQAIIDAQKEMTNQLQREAAQALWESRDVAYQEMLLKHRDERADLSSDQKAGITRYDLLLLNPPSEAPAPRGPSLTTQFGRAADEVTDARGPPAAETARLFTPAADEVTASGPRDRGPSKDVSVALAGGFLSLADGLADSLSGSAPEVKPDPYVSLRAQEAAFDHMMDANRQQAREEAERWAERERDREREYDRER